MTSEELKQGLGFIVDKNSCSTLVGYANNSEDCGTSILRTSKAILKTADSSEKLVKLYRTIKWCLRMHFPQVTSSQGNVFL